MMKVSSSKSQLCFVRLAGDTFFADEALSFSWALSDKSLTVGSAGSSIFRAECAAKKGSCRSGRCSVTPLIIGQVTECSRYKRWGMVTLVVEMMKRKPGASEELMRRDNFYHQFSAVSDGLVVKHVEAFNIFTQDVNLMLRIDVVCYRENPQRWFIILSFHTTCLRIEGCRSCCREKSKCRRNVFLVESILDISLWCKFTWNMQWERLNQKYQFWKIWNWSVAGTQISSPQLSATIDASPLIQSFKG